MHFIENIIHFTDRQNNIDTLVNQIVKKLIPTYDIEKMLIYLIVPCLYNIILILF